MKAVFTLLLILFFGVAAMAHEGNTPKKVQTLKKGLTLKNTLELKTSSGPDLLALVYIEKQSRIKKALLFHFRLNRPKLT